MKRSYIFQIWKHRKQSDSRENDYMFVREYNSNISWNLIHGTPGYNYAKNRTSLNFFINYDLITHVEDGPDLIKYTKMMDDYYLELEKLTTYGETKRAK